MHRAAPSSSSHFLFCSLPATPPGFFITHPTRIPSGLLQADSILLEADSMAAAPSFVSRAAATDTPPASGPMPAATHTSPASGPAHSVARHAVTPGHTAGGGNRQEGPGVLYARRWSDRVGVCVWHSTLRLSSEHMGTGKICCGDDAPATGNKIPYRR
jgi:hypothetical protein